jgi:hypothetical protein
MPGVRETVARVLVAEIGFDMTRFPTAGHLVSWAGLCPRLDESAGESQLHPHPPQSPLAEDDPRPRRVGRRPQEGRLPLRAIPPPQESPGPEEGHCRGCRLDADAAYYLLRGGVDYRDLGAAHFDP